MRPRLNEYEGFEDLIRAAADHHRLLPSLVSRDYWLTRVLEAVATARKLEERVVFKGGTSLSKGWKLIDRFSEDIDLLLTGDGFGPPPSSNAERKSVLKGLRVRIEEETPLRLPDLTKMPKDEEKFYYVRGPMHLKLRYPIPQGAPGEFVLVESGYRGGPYPRVRGLLRSLIAEYLDHQPKARAALDKYSADLAGFEIDLLKPERTFAEKLLALHLDMIDGINGAERVRTRHYSDVAELFVKSEDVRATLESGGLRDLVRDAVNISNTYWDTSIDPEALDLPNSPALAPSVDQIAILKARYESPNERVLYFRGATPFQEILSRMEQLRVRLARGAWH